jgi:hypothetical protein
VKSKLPLSLQKSDIVGRKLVRILQSYEVLDGWVHFAQNYFILDSGVAFSFPYGAKPGFISAETPGDAKEINHSVLAAALGSTITGVYRPRSNGDVEPDDIVMRLDGGLWVWQVSSAPEGVHGCVGIHVEREPPEPISELVDYWSEADT